MLDRSFIKEECTETIPTPLPMGKALLDDGNVIEVKDMMCFVKDVHNRY